MFKTQKAIKLGIHPRTLYALRDDQLVDRLDRGLYRVADAKPLAHPDLVTVVLKVPRGVICLVSALAFRQMSTLVPHSVYLAIPANDQTPALRYPPLRLFWYASVAFSDGIEQVDIDGVPVRMFSVERTLADCFKYRNKIGIDVCVEALNLYRRRGKNKLEHYAKLCRVERVMRPYREAIL